jgi:cytochrome c556
MKIRLPLFALICAVTALPVIRAQDAAPKQMPAKQDTTPLGEQMDKISGAFRKLGRQIADATKNEDSLAQVAIIHDAATEALKLEPSWKQEKPAEDQAKFVADFQAEMKGFIADVDKLAAALKAGNNDEAAKLLQALKADQDKGHSDFRKPKKKKSA